MIEIQWSNKALKQLAKIPTDLQTAVRLGVNALAAWPEVKNVKKLVDTPGYRLRVGRYRIFFDIYADGRTRILYIEEVVKRDDRTYS